MKGDVITTVKGAIVDDVKLKFVNEIGIVCEFKILVEPENSLLVTQVYKAFGHQVCDLLLASTEDETVKDLPQCRIEKIDIANRYKKVGDEKIPVEYIRIHLTVKDEDSRQVCKLHSCYKITSNMTIIESEIVENNNQIEIFEEESHE